MSSATANLTVGEKSSAFSAVVRKSFSSFSVDSILAGAAKLSKEDESTSIEDDNSEYSNYIRPLSPKIDGQSLLTADDERIEEARAKISLIDQTQTRDDNTISNFSSLLNDRNKNYPNLDQTAASAFRIATSAAYNLLQLSVRRRSSPDHLTHASQIIPRLRNSPSPNSAAHCGDEDDDEDINADDDDQDVVMKNPHPRLHIRSEEEISGDPSGDPRDEESGGVLQTVLRPTALGPLQEHTRFPGMRPPSLLGQLPSQPGLWPSLPFLHHHQLSLRALQSKL